MKTIDNNNIHPNFIIVDEVLDLSFPRQPTWKVLYYFVEVSNNPLKRFEATKSAFPHHDCNLYKEYFHE